MSFFKEKIVTQNSPIISKEFVPIETCLFSILRYRLSTISFFQTIQICLATSYTTSWFSDEPF